MNFMESVEAMKEGKKVRRGNWLDIFACKKDNNFVVSNDTQLLVWSNVEATDWEIVEDKEERNPAHFCMNCDNYLGHRGFCSKECHDKWYDEVYPVEDKDKKTLSDKIWQPRNHCGRDLLSIDVKEAIKEFIEWMNIHRLGINPDKYLPKAKEIFGERLL